MARIQTKLQEKIQTSHIVMEIFIGISATLVFFPLSKVTQHFNGNCLLNSDIWVTKHTNHSVSLDVSKTVFGSGDECDYTTFVNVVVALHSLIWIWFFFHIDTLRCHNGSTINLLLPALLTHFVLLICCIISSVKIGDGFSHWCDKLEANGRVRRLRMACKDYESLSWTESRSKFYTFSVMALSSAWLLVVFLVVSLLVTGIYLYWDFLATAFKDKDDRPSSPILETSGFVDDGVGVVNKGALTSSKDHLINDGGRGDSDSYSDVVDVGSAAAAVAGDDNGSRHGWGVDPAQVVVDIHGQDSAVQSGSGLRKRESAGVEDS